MSSAYTSKRQWCFAQSNCSSLVLSPIDLSCWLTLPALPGNVWSSSRKCWRKTGSDECLRSRNRSWGCSAASSPRWALTHQHLYVVYSSFRIPADSTASRASGVCSDGREESWRRAGGDQREPGRLQPRRKDAPHSVVTEQESRSVHLGTLMLMGFLRFPDSFSSIAFTLCECSEIFPITLNLLQNLW